MKTKVIGIFKPPSGVEFKMKTEISQVAIYPVYDKNDKKIVDKMQLNLTVHLTDECLCSWGLETTALLNYYKLNKLRYR